MRRILVRHLWLALGWTSVALGILGIALPLLPTTPFLLLAAYSFSRGSDRLYMWLITHPTFGPPIEQWRQYRAISRRSKLVGTGTMVALVLISALLAVPTWALTAQATVLIVVAGFLWTRPEPPASPPSGDTGQSPQTETGASTPPDRP